MKTTATNGLGSVLEKPIRLRAVWKKGMPPSAASLSGEESQKSREEQRWAKDGEKQREYTMKGVFAAVLWVITFFIWLGVTWMLLK